MLAAAGFAAACSGRIRRDPEPEDAGNGMSSEPEHGQNGTSSEPVATLLRGAVVFDGLRRLDEPHDVLVRGDTIAEIGVGLQADAAEVVDAEGMTLLPGLIDAHTHLNDAADLAHGLLFGVTTQLDMFTRPRTGEQLRQDQQGSDVYSDLRSAGWLATASGGHGTQFRLAPPVLSDASRARAWVEDRLAEGSDYIKIVSERAFEFNPLPNDIIAALIDAADELGALTVTHVSEAELAYEAVRAGTNGLAHVFWDYDEEELETTVEACREADAFVVATLALVSPSSADPISARLIDDDRIAQWLTDDVRSQLAQPSPAGDDTWTQRAKAAVGALHDAGVTILAGSDAPNPGTFFGATLHGELELLVEAGLPPVDALAGATGRTAERFGLTDRGRIEVGRRADLLLVEGDPTTDITATREIAAIYRGGQLVDRERVATHATYDDLD